ncbi:MAG: thioredoxin domain-containing protein [Candidatus Poribacteria bacterium]|nr:thioredoxin domain-containing protein [Candidatus Poribacteria bacterium]
MNLSKSIQISLVILIVLQIAIFSGCDQYKELTNDPPEITNLTVPVEVEYGETVQLRIRAFDADDDDLTYIWDVSEGTLVSDTGSEVQWTAPESDEEMVPSKVVTVNVYVRDGSEKDASKTATILVYSKPYRIAEVLSGTYRLVSKSVHGDPVQVAGTLRLTPTTFTQEFQEVLEGEAQSLKQFVTGSYKLVRPFNQSSGTIHWFTHGNPRPSVITYTWDGRFLALVFRADATQYIYNRGGAVPEVVETDDVEPEPIAPEPIEEDVEPEPIAPEPEPIAPEPVEELEELNPDPINTDGKPVTITDATFNANVLNAELPVVLEFEADWCPFCRQMKPVVESVALEHRNTFIIGKLDIDENRQTTGKYKVNGIPTYLVFRDGAVAARFAGAMPKAIFEQKIFDALK